VYEKKKKICATLLPLSNCQLLMTGPYNTNILLLYHIATASRIMRPTVIEFDSFDFSPFDSINKKFGSTL